MPRELKLVCRQRKYGPNHFVYAALQNVKYGDWKCVYPITRLNCDEDIDSNTLQHIPVEFTILSDINYFVANIIRKLRNLDEICN